MDRHLSEMVKLLGAVECFDKSEFDFLDNLCNCIENN